MTPSACRRPKDDQRGTLSEKAGKPTGKCEVCFQEMFVQTPNRNPDTNVRIHLLITLTGLAGLKTQVYCCIKMCVTFTNECSEEMFVFRC